MPSTESLWREVLAGGAERHAARPDVPALVHAWPMVRWILDVPREIPVAGWTGPTPAGRCAIAGYGRRLASRADRVALLLPANAALGDAALLSASLRRLEHRARRAGVGPVPPPSRLVFDWDRIAPAERRAADAWGCVAAALGLHPNRPVVDPPWDDPDGGGVVGRTAHRLLVAFVEQTAGPIDPVCDDRVWFPEDLTRCVRSLRRHRAALAPEETGVPAAYWDATVDRIATDHGGALVSEAWSLVLARLALPPRWRFSDAATWRPLRDAALRRPFAQLASLGAVLRGRGKPVRAANAASPAARTVVGFGESGHPEDVVDVVRGMYAACAAAGCPPKRPPRRRAASNTGGRGSNKRPKRTSAACGGRPDSPSGGGKRSSSAEPSTVPP